MTKEEVIKKTLNILETFIRDDINSLCNAKLFKVFISNDGCPLKIIQCARGTDSEEEAEKESLIKCAKHLYYTNPELILWVWENEKSCLVME